MTRSLIQSGRPRLSADFGLILDLRESEHLGWSRVASEYIKRTGQYISKQTCQKRYEEVTSRKSFAATSGQIVKPPRSPPYSGDPTPTILPFCCYHTTTRICN